METPAVTSTSYSILIDIATEAMVFMLTVAVALLANQIYSRKSGSRSGVRKVPSSSSPTSSPARSRASSPPMSPATPGKIPAATFDFPATPTAEIQAFALEVCEAPSKQPGLKVRGKMVTQYFDIHRSDCTGAMLKDALIGSDFRPIDFYSSLLQSAIRTGKHQHVDDLFQDMSHQGVARTLHLYEDTMKCLAGQKQHHMALGLYDRLAADGLSPSSVTYSCLSSFALEVGQVKRSIFYFKQLALMTTPSIRAYMTVLRAYAKCQDWPSSLAVLRDMQKRGVKVDALVLNVILATGVAADRLEGVEGLLLEFEEQKPSVQDTVSYNTLLKGYAQKAHFCKAETLIGRMMSKGIPPNAITYNTLMDAAVRGLRVAEAWRILSEMRDAGLRPDKFTCSILVKGLHKGCSMDQIRSCMDLVREVGPECDYALQRSLYQAMIEAASSLENGRTVILEVLAQTSERDIVLSGSCKKIMAKVMAQPRTLSPQGSESDISTTCSNSSNASDTASCSSRNASPNRRSQKQPATGSKALGALLSCCQQEPQAAVRAM
mmetsp:Transcript_7384/g.16178  ORF Transcript_7384/g.16178 Transcript_7384/m.16178 type:complete len:548 (-) Transcript_7384:130-1773(-)|eukprot:CAMPEP_0178460790 /NCGR_PEP_ID=MMETSP0689_2-20121128/48922_1 /TAXON_ID=160604 /ORGANISM="Amphidinium massartii, Strain CS-259" /LENGTH=547 /DNA_ID=CAMNT_0020087499 /DNA_START=137 /DNA_END=1780 /DNA_ORIENTATION=-